MLGNRQTALQQGCSLLPTWGPPPAPRPRQHQVPPPLRAAAVRTGVWPHLAAAPTRLSLAVRHAEHLVMCLFALCVFSSVKCLFITFSPFPDCVVCLFLLLNCESPVWSWDSGPLLGWLLGNTSSQSVVCFSSFNVDFCKTTPKTLVLMKIYYFFTLCVMSMARSLRNLCLAIDTRGFLDFFLTVLWFCVLHVSLCPILKWGRLILSLCSSSSKLV